ncbi:hypothetical protein GDO78_011449 [Eleutherodactylus coqui]|uniref:Uncharacterized protein n=1 Tax=Eleutherodactylus coqui TaxID=57060 RepID=A0A8J6FA07_ELECQ|nr:hypothetical protein GDO78_011449 [Eleutherodactylus coqui]
MHVHASFPFTPVGPPEVHVCVLHCPILQDSLGLHSRSVWQWRTCMLRACWSQRNGVEVRTLCCPPH